MALRDSTNLGDSKKLQDSKKISTQKDSIKSPTKIFLSHPSIVCSAGSENLLESFAKGKPFLTKDSHFLRKDIFVGQCKNLISLPQNTPLAFKTRTNEILYNAILKLEPVILEIAQCVGKNNIAVSLGTTTTGIGENYLALEKYYASHNAKEAISYKSMDYLQERSSLSNPAEFVKWYFGLDSFAFASSSACTSGGKAIIQAARLLKSNLCKAVICGGVDSLNHLTINGFSSLDILSSGISKPFTKQRDGINIGEGAGIFILTSDKVLQEFLPLQTHFNIELLGYKSNNDAFHITLPSQNLQHQCEILQDFKGVDYINLHGTGTIANDKMEADLIAQTFPNTPASSIKPFIGHTLGAAGGIELGICAMMILESLKNGESPLPPHIYENDFNDIRLVQKGEKKSVKTAISTSFAFGGDNSAIFIGAKQ